MAKTISRDVRRPNVIREHASVEGGVWDTQSFQLALEFRLCPEHPHGLSFRVSTEVRRNEQLDVCFLGGLGDLPLNLEGPGRNGTDDDLHTRQGVLDGLAVGIVDLDHLGVAFNRGLGVLGAHSQWVLSYITYWVDTLPGGKEQRPP